jgi:hypothetical protein
VQVDKKNFHFRGSIAIKNRWPHTWGGDCWYFECESPTLDG